MGTLEARLIIIHRCQTTINLALQASPSVLEDVATASMILNLH